MNQPNRQRADPSRIAALLALLAAVGVSSPAFAGTRTMTWSTGARAYPEGEIELQTWLTTQRWFGGELPDGSPHGRLLSGGVLHWATIVAFADAWELAILASIAQAPSLKEAPSPVALDQGSFQLRRQLTAMRESKPVDVLALVELTVPVASWAPRGHGARAMVAAEADVGDINLVANLGLRTAFDRGGLDLMVDLSAGAMVRFSELILAGLELFGHLPLSGGANQRQILYAGPTLTLQRGRLWAGLSLAWGADKPSSAGLFDPGPVPIEPPQLLGAAQTFNGFCGRVLVGVNL